MARERARHADPEETPSAAAPLEPTSSRTDVCEPPEPFHPALRHLVRLLAQQAVREEMAASDPKETRCTCPRRHLRALLERPAICRVDHGPGPRGPVALRRSRLASGGSFHG